MAVAPPQYDLAARAANLAQIKYGGAINQAQRERDLAALRNQTALDALNRWETSGKTGINQAWDIGDANLRTSREHQALDWQEADRETQGIWNNARTMGGAVRDDAQNYLNDLAGIIGATPEALMSSTNQIQSLAAQQLERLNQYEGNRRQSIQERAANAQNFNMMKADQATQARASAIATFLNNLQKQRGDVQTRGLEDQFMFGGRLIDLQNERGGYEAEANLEGADRQFAQLGAYNDDLLAEAEMAQRASIAQAQLNDAAAARSAAAARASQSDALDWAKFHASQSQFDRQLAFDREKYQSTLNQPADPVSYGSGLQAARAFGQKAFSPDEFQDVDAMLQAAYGNANMPWTGDPYNKPDYKERLYSGWDSALDAYAKDIEVTRGSAPGSRPLWEIEQRERLANDPRTSQLFDFFMNGGRI